ncbi:hypothetical protein ABB37_04426 [Leptomonas pyrrhocoris]|uniref:Uncharacterized protein n=1 Tax=Leptomonas pyrrhocoris TaxID=157538 RepID=A0A0M9G2J8_LEPPY|nr:hypothetical protein ABB37_04426 [Leptomonas pyrrhocoris]XP_015659504.1 hypothetical protein ABB37_04426 [Leptomonas pyrrhocoris]KPA81064.1 hypothetical protein ABB37_04426 [Leptomonas pyrrhocoris]KPA81065.1 hypothetical protein ABB37_04426 [Leptomonas pyrrhocoris]|eukprot:XP_015659503.1 hypothetical protein ABB37_04426 [Leptomonas pyrrhocoris]
MLTDYWLLSDLDGTLISTPHKAQGRYLPITQSPCYEPVKKWLSNGGNICVVTTADVRVIEQVYHPLRPFLKTQAEYIAEVAATTAKDKTTPPRRRGCLLLSLYTGAVLYWCTADAIVMLPGYASAVHCATRESIELAAAYKVLMPRAKLFVDGSQTKLMEEPQMCVRGTCISAATAQWLQRHIETLYFSYIHDILAGTDKSVREAMQWLSRRYKCMWGGLLQYLDIVYNVSERKAAPAELVLKTTAFRTLEALVTQPPSDPAAVAWKMQYLRSRRELLTAVGILRMEYVEARLSYEAGAANSGASQKAAVEKAERAELVEHCTKVLLDNLVPTLATQVAGAAASMARFLVDLLGPSARDLKRRMSEAKPATPSPPPPSSNESEANIAQVILLGLPLRLFSKYFRAHVADLVRGGVSAMPQPNSVVFSKIGVSKSTALRYLLGKGRVASVQDDFQLHFTYKPGSDATPAALAANFAGCVRRCHGIAMGDNPQSTDYELTVFRDVPFLSVEKEAQRVERQKRILRRLQRTQNIESRGGQPVMPDGSPAPSYVDLVRTLRRSGPMMDDRLFRNVNYVGAEEEGAALFLSSLLHYAATEPTAVQGQVTPEEFHHAIAKAQGTSRDQVMLRLPPSKL